MTAGGDVPGDPDEFEDTDAVEGAPETASAPDPPPVAAGPPRSRLVALSSALLDADNESSYEPSIDTSRTSTGRNKVAAFDGLRGIACILVLLGHCWIIVPMDVINSAGALRGVFFSQNLAVITFFVLGGFLVTRSLLEQQRRTGAIPIGRFWLRRIVRIGAQLVPFAVAIVVVSVFDRWDAYTGDQTRRSIINILRFTFNWSLVNDPLGNREDLGHLWYLSVEQQTYLVLVLLLAWLARYRVGLVLSLGIAAIAVMVNRWFVFDQEGWYVASLRTLTRADGLLLGAGAAVTLPLVRQYVDVGRRATLPTLGVLVFVVLLTPQLSNVAFLQTQGIVFVLAATAFVLGIAVSARPDGLAERLLSWAPFLLVGRVSFPLFLWHYPAFYAAARWARDVPWLLRALLTLAALATIVAITQFAIERPVGRWLDRNRHGDALRSKKAAGAATA